MTAIADVKGNDLARLGVHGEPNPLFVRVLLHEAAHFIGFHLQALEHDVRMACDRLDMQMVRQGLKTVGDETQEPLESHSNGTANAPQGEPFEQQTLDQRLGLIRDEVLLRALHKLARARLALMILFAIMSTAILLEAG